MYIDSLSLSLGAETPFVILLFSAIVAVDIFPLEALTLLIKHCQCTNSRASWLQVVSEAGYLTV